MKRIMAVVILIVLSVCLILFLVSCSRRIVRFAENNLSYFEAQRQVGVDEEFKISISKGTRELVPLADGVCREVADYHEIKVVPLKLGGIDGEVYFKYGNCTGKLERVSARHELVAQIPNDASYGEISIQRGDVISVITLFNITDGLTAPDKAFETACGALKESIKNGISGGKLNREVQFRILEDEIGGEIFYYTAIISEEKEFSAVLINAETGLVVAKR